MVEANCVDTLAGWETKVGWVEEDVCGETPLMTEGSNGVPGTNETAFSAPTAKYSYVYTGSGTSAVNSFRTFGLLMSFSPELNRNSILKRGIGSQFVESNIHGAYETTLSLSYHTDSLARFERFVMGTYTGSAGTNVTGKTGVKETLSSQSGSSLTLAANKIVDYNGDGVVDAQDVVVYVDDTTPYLATVLSVSGATPSVITISETLSSDDVYVYYYKAGSVEEQYYIVQNAPTCSINRRIMRDEENYVTDGYDRNELWNYCMVDTWSMEVGTDDMITFNEDLICQYVREGINKGDSTDGYTAEQKRQMDAVSGVDATSIFYDKLGAWGATEYMGNYSLYADTGDTDDFTPLMFYDMKVELAVRKTMAFTASDDFVVTISSVTDDVVDLFNDLVLNKNDIYSCIDVNGVEVKDEISMVVHVSNTLYIIFRNEIDAGAGIIIFPVKKQIYDITSFSLEFARNLKQTVGVYNTVPVPYEIHTGVIDITGSMDFNLSDFAEVEQFYNDEYTRMWITIGTKVINIWNIKFDGALPESPEEDLYTVSMDYGNGKLFLVDTA